MLFRSAVSPALLHTPLENCQHKAWVEWALALFHAGLALHDGVLSGKNGVLEHLEGAEAAARELQPWAMSVVLARRSEALIKESRYREAGFFLRRLETSHRQGHAPPGAIAFAHVLKSRMRYDQGRYEEAEQLLVKAPAGARMTAQTLGMQALTAGRRIFLVPPEEARQLLAEAASNLLLALGHVFLYEADASLLAPLCSNLGKTLLRGIERGILSAESGDTALLWLAANQQVCRKLGVGQDSVAAELLLADFGTRHGFSGDRWPPLLRQTLSVSGDMAGLLASILQRARKIGNRLEIAEVLRRQLRLAPCEKKAAPLYFEAFELANEL